MMQTYFVYPTNPIVTSLEDEEDAEPVLIASMEDISVVPELNQCQLMKVPARTRRQTPSPFADQDQKENGSHSSAIMNMVKPHGSSSSPSSLRLSQVSPEQLGKEKGGEQEQETGQRRSPGLFIASDSTQPAADQRECRTSKNSKCVVC